jgi:uncharacterized protein (TIGR03066 family)
MRLPCAVVLGLMVFTLAGSARADDAAKLVGKWEVTKSGGETPVGSMVEFTKDGKVTANVTLEGKDLKFTGTYKLSGTKLRVDLALNEQKLDQEFTVKFNGDDEMTLEDAKKMTDTLKKKK